MGVLDIIKPYARTAKLHVLRRQAEKLAKTPVAAERGESPDLPPPAFIFACGRSGTTILGKLFGCHPEVAYLSEPYHLWAVIDPALDLNNLHVRTPPRLWWDESEASDAIQTRFTRLIIGERARTGRRVLIEKTPHNAYRLGLIEALTGGRANFIHIVRDGVDVARSVDRLATNQPYRMAGRSDYNQWWGSNHLKWQRLETEGPKHGYFSEEEVAQLKTNQQRGAYEWLTSLGEADRWRPVFGDRLLEITYRQLTSEPRETLTALAGHVGATAPDSWLDEACAMLSPERNNTGGELPLPPRLAKQFNAYQERHGLDNRATPMEG